MTAQELYYDFHLLLNKNNELKDINIEAPNFVRLYNREAERWLADYIERNNSSDNNLILDYFLVPDYILTRTSSTSTQDIYSLPENCFSVIEGDFRSVVVGGGCTGVIYNTVSKSQQVNPLLANKFSAPSLSWERGLAKITNAGIIVYKNGFDITSTIISYYKIPEKIDLEGYTGFDGVLSSNIDPKYSDYIAQQILDKVVTEVQREFENSAGFQLSQQRERSF